MPLLIDAYNVLHTTMPPALAGLDTASLCQALARTPWQHDTITVVCDGQPGPLGLLESPVEHVQLVYSGVGRTADDEIIVRINESSAPRRLRVVSSDREIRAAARRRRAMTWTSEDFLHKLVEALRHNGPAARHDRDKPAPGRLDDQQVRDWLSTFGFADDVDATDGDEADDDDASRHWPPW